MSVNDFPHEEGEPERITEPDDPELRRQIAKIAAEHGFPLSDWTPSRPPIPVPPDDQQPPRS